jgi:hypothetical protein
MNQQRADIRARVTTLLPMVAYKKPKASENSQS